MSNILMEDNLLNRVLTKIFDLCLLNVLTVLFCIPIVTAGASLTAMYAVMMKMARNEEGPIVKSFVREFKSNLKGSFGGWLLLLMGFILLLVDLSLWTQNQVEYRSLFYGFTAAMLFALSTLADWYFAVRSRFEETSKTALKNAVKFELIYLPASIVMGAYTAGLAVLLVHAPVLIALVPLAGLALLEYPKAFYIRRRFDAYIKTRKVPQAEHTALADEEQEAAAGEKRGYAENTGKKRTPAVSRREKIAAMSRREKIEYVFTYYKAWMFSIVLVVAAVVWISCHYFFYKTECGFSCALVNGYMEKSDTVFSEELDEYFGFQSPKEYAYFDTEYQIAYPDVENEAADTSFYEKFFLNIRMGALDAAIMPESYMEYCNSVSSVFYDVSQVLSEEQLQSWEPYFVTGQDEEGNEYVCGIDISRLAFIEKEKIGFVKANAGEAFILAFPCNSEHREACQAFVDFLEGYEE